MEQIVQVCYSTIFICDSQMQPNFMNVVIIIFHHLQIIWGDNPHYANAVSRVKMISRKRGVMQKLQILKKSTLL